MIYTEREKGGKSADADFPPFCNYSEPHLDSAALHLDVASRHIKFQEELFVHASMTHSSS